MKPGRELDIFIAEKVMDDCVWEIWFDDSGTLKPTDSGGIYYRCQTRTQAESYLDDFRKVGWKPVIMDPNPKPYSTDISAAWEVVESLIKDEWRREVSVVNTGIKEWELTVKTPIYCDCPIGGFGCNCGLDWITVKKRSSTLPHAICLAALKVVGVEI